MGILIGALILLVMGSFVFATPQSDGLMGYWTFDEGNGGVAKDTVAAYNGTIMDNEGDQWVIGKSGNALRFDGIDDYVKITDSALLEPKTGVFSVTAWIKPDSIKSTPGNGTASILYKGNSSIFNCGPGNEHWRLVTRGVFGNVLEYVACDASGYKTLQARTNTIPVGVWTHVVAVHDVAASPDTVTFYINGKQTPTTYITQHDITDASYVGDLRIGSLFNYHFFNGAIDEVGIWNKGLSQEEVKDMYQRHTNYLLTFASDMDTGWELYTVKTDGSAGPVKLFELTTADSRWPAWAPTLTKIAFSTNKDGNDEIYLVDDIGGINSLVNLTNDAASDRFPTWSPDGNSIIFTSNRDGNDEIYMMNPDGTNQTRITFTPEDEQFPAVSPDGIKIAFQSNKNGNWDIYTIDINGQNVTQLTNGPGANSYPSYSPDASMITFSSDRNGDSDIYMMNANGGEQTPISDNPKDDMAPKWSPDGEYIVFHTTIEGYQPISKIKPDGTGWKNLAGAGGYGPGYNEFPAWNRDGTKVVFMRKSEGNKEIYTMDIHDGSLKRLTNNNVIWDWLADWSPDGEKIVYVSREYSGDDDIVVMDANGSNKTRLTFAPSMDYTPHWSPDGTKIVFTSDRDGGVREVYVMNADGTNQTNLSNNPAIDWAPDFSPDGSKIVFISARDGGNREIYVMNADGSEQTRLTSTDQWESHPQWSPDGTKIAYTGFTQDYPDLLHTTYDIWVMNPDGTNQTKLTDNPAVDEMPEWSPDGTKIAFHSFRDFNWEIYIMDPDGSNQTRITNNLNFDAYPAWRPF